MSISPRNLWPEDIAVTETVAPAAILKEQASLLGERTKNLVEGRVAPSAPSLRGGNFEYAFYLVAPALDNYHYHLFSVSHGVEFYPLTIQPRGSFGLSGLLPRGEVELAVNNEEEFLEELAKLFSSDKTKHIIASLIAQSRAV
ncbi:MAG TPA: hypothetical protein VJH03_22420 [Blastocatellia bacterium]|nr:hypothetical protein [Blastocatellia bacterium]